MAPSNSLPREGKDNAEREANEAARWGALAALLVSRYNPNAAVRPHQMTVTMPGMSPPDANA